MYAPEDLWIIHLKAAGKIKLCVYQSSLPLPLQQQQTTPLGVGVRGTFY